MANDGTPGQDQMLATEKGVRNLFVLSGVGMVSIIVALLILATARPQGQAAPLDDTQFQNTLAAATEDLEGYELVGEDRAKIDIRHAIELVAERGVDLDIVAIEAQPSAMMAAPAAPATPAPSPVEETPESAQASTGGTLPQVDGATVFAANCASCHQATGAGIPGAFPPLAGGHAANIVNADGGRAYLIRSLMYGLQGAIVVNGMTYMGVMPAWPQLTDEDIAAVLTYVVGAWDNADVLDATFEPFTIEEVTSARGEGLMPANVYELRPDVP